MDLRKEKSRSYRLRKAVVSELNIYTISTDLQDMMETCSDIEYYDSDSEEGLLSEMLGSEDEAFEFRMMFSTLAVDIEKLYDDVVNGSYSEMLEEHFDSLFVGLKIGNERGGYWGYDESDGDYYSLEYSFECREAEQLAAAKLKRLTKDQFINTAHICFHVAIGYLSVKTRYENLSAAIDILRGENAGFLQQIRAIEEAYKKAEKERFVDWSAETIAFERLIKDLPSEVWVQ